MRERHAQILIVDNDERIVELVAWFLKKRGFEVRTTSTFAGARELIADRRPDLMLSDIDLGAENAMEELPLLEAAGNLPPTLVVSGYLDPAIQAELSALAPVLDTLAKPFDFAVLEERVMSCLDRAGEAVAVAVPAAAAADHEPVPADEEGWIEITPVRSPGISQRVS